MAAGLRVGAAWMPEGGHPIGRAFHSLRRARSMISVGPFGTLVGLEVRPTYYIQLMKAFSADESILGIRVSSNDIFGAYNIHHRPELSRIAC